MNARGIVVRRAAAVALAVVVIAGAASSVPARAEERPFGDIDVWTRIGAPGAPEGLAIRDGLAYVGTHVPVKGNAGGPPSKIFVYDLETRALVRSLDVEGQNLAATHGILAMAFDAAGRLYVIDRNPARVARIDFTTSPPTQMTYATIPDLHPCHSSPAPCAPTTVDEPPFPDYFAFDAAGNLYLTDLQAATIFHVAPGGGTATIWYQDARFDGIFGLNGIAVDPSGTKLYFAMTSSMEPLQGTRGSIYTLPIVDAPTAADLELFHTFPQPAAGPDGFAFGASGRLYVALAGSNQIAVLEADGTPVATFPDAVSNQLLEIPVDLPASVGFDGKGSLLVTNQSFFAGNSDHYAVLDVAVGDTALRLIEPALP